MPMVENPQPLALAMMMMTGRKKTMKTMTTARGMMRIMSLSLKRTNAHDHVDVCVHTRAGHSHQALPAI